MGGASDGFGEGLRGVAATPHVEGDAAHSEPQLSGTLQQPRRLLERRAILVAHHALRVAVVDQDAEEELGARVESSGLEELLLAVKDGPSHTLLSREAQV